MDINYRLNELLDKYGMWTDQTQKIQKAEQLIGEVFSELVGKYRVAIRGGGIHTEKILSVLPVKVKKQIIGIFDENSSVEQIDNIDVMDATDLEKKVI